MLPDLMKRNRLIGKPRKEILALLGSPAQDDGGTSSVDRYLTSETWDVIDPVRVECLAIQYDPTTQRVTECRLEVHQKVGGDSLLVLQR